MATMGPFKYSQVKRISVLVTTSVSIVLWAFNALCRFLDIKASFRSLELNLLKL